MTRQLMTLSAALLVALAPVLGAEALPPSSPESVGLSAERLERLRAGMQRYVDDGRVAGIVTLVARNGRLAHLEAYGKADVEQARAMTKDAIFRIASQSKALTSVAVMMLVEEGRIGLGDPVSRYIPAFAKTTVAVPAPAGAARALVTPGTTVKGTPAAAHTAASSPPLPKRNESPPLRRTTNFPRRARSRRSSCAWAGASRPRRSSSAKMRT